MPLDFEDGESIRRAIVEPVVEAVEKLFDLKLSSLNDKIDRHIYTSNALQDSDRIRIAATESDIRQLKGNWGKALAGFSALTAIMSVIGSFLIQKAKTLLGIK
jgi:hypothetical protein